VLAAVEGDRVADVQGRVRRASILDRVELDFDPTVTWIVSQPFWLCWTTAAGNAGGTPPDLLVLVDDGSAEGAVLVLDSRPLKLIAAEDRACALPNRRYAAWDRLDSVVVANQKWLAGYRHPRWYVEPVADRLLEVFTRTQPLMEGGNEQHQFGRSSGP
jgi:hypothetical protein